MWRASRWWFRVVPQSEPRIGPEFIRDDGGKPSVTTEDACLDALREAARRLEKSPTKADYEELGLTPASATVIRTLGGWNDAKEAAGLSTNPSTGSRVGPPPDSVSEEIRERWTELSVDQRWHYRNVEWNTERTLQRRAELRKWVAERKAAEGCATCDETDPRCLDYHHRDSEEKTVKVSQLIVKGASKERIREEIQHCDVLCANCHRREHAHNEGLPVAVEFRGGSLLPTEKQEADSFSERSPRERRRLWVDSYKRERGCNRCEFGVAASLVLHHVDGTQKGLAVGRLVSDGYGTERIRREMEHCVVLCSNCHRKEHRERRKFADPGENTPS